MYKQTILFCAGVVCLGALNQALAADTTSCSDASGKITNNAQQDGSTLGLVALKLGEQKLKCGIIGQPQSFGPYNFKHTIVCDDKASADTAQAQVTFNTSFLSPPSDVKPCPDNSPGGPISFSFEEVSTPIPSSARGAFDGVTEDGSIYIRGSFNCDGGIIMKFKGLICTSNSLP